MTGGAAGGWDELVYVAGSPTRQATGGRHELTVKDDGNVALTWHLLGRNDRWEGTATDLLGPRLAAGLADAGYPTAPPLAELVPDETTRSILTRRDGEESVILMGWRQGRSEPGWRELFAILDSVLTQMAPKHAVAPNLHPPLVRDVRRVGHH